MRKGRRCGWTSGSSGLARGPPLAPMWGAKGRPSPAQLQPPARQFPGAAGLTAFSCSSRSFIPVPRRPEAGERVPGERPEVAAGRAGAKELEAKAEAGGGRGLGGASEATGGSAAPPPPAPPAPSAPNPAPGSAPARSADPPGWPAPHLGRAPRSSLKGPSGSPPPRLPLPARLAPRGAGKSCWRAHPFRPTAAHRLPQAVPGPAAHSPANRELWRCALRLAGGRESQASRREEGRSEDRSWPSRGLRVGAVDAFS